MPRALTRVSLATGAKWLADIDSDLARILDHHGVPPLWGRRPGFTTLIQIIVEQQVSLAAAATMYKKLVRLLGGMNPELVLAKRATGLREIGLTRQKAGYCVGLADRVVSGALDLTAIARHGDDDGRAALLSVPGLGPWSVDIYYLMALRRCDIWPQGDLALALSLQNIKRLDALPTKSDQLSITAVWSPCRSIAARLLWMDYLAARGQYSPH